jgi:glycosyltransferase involved in cell wall biosynthesis
VPLVAPVGREFEGRLLFLGSANQANVDSLRFCLREVWPRVSGRAQLLVAGTVCDEVDLPPEVDRMPSGADVSDAYDASDIVIVPIRFGTGLKIKTIEALGRSKPTISSSVGAEGVEMAQGKALWVVD